jgi:hypothetical protein
MGKKPLPTLGEELPPEADAFHVVVGGNVYLINFAVDQSNLRTQHEHYINVLVVPFITKAAKRFGPGDYALHVIGAASATGDWDHDMTLSLQRAYKSATYAINQFEKEKMKDPLLARVNIEPAIQGIGRMVSTEEARLFRLKSSPQIEKSQAHHRSVLFRLTAGFTHPKGASTFYIREHYRFKFKKVEEPLPAFLKRVEQFLADNPLLNKILGDLKDKLLKPFLTAIGPFYSLVGKTLVAFVIPQDADYCYEIKDYRSTHALYRFSGVEHKFSLSLMDLLGLLASLYSVLKTVNDILSKEGKVEKWAEVLLKQLDQQVSELLGKSRPIVGDAAADAIKNFFELVKTGQLRTSIFAPTSDWVPFTFYDGGPDHDVINLNGPARRFANGAVFVEGVELDFAGYVPNNWVDYNARALIITFSGRNSLLGDNSNALGQLMRIKGPYLTDISPGLFDPITE